MNSHKITVNDFTVEFREDGHPLWTTIFYQGRELCMVHHSEVRDLEYALTRTLEQLRAKLGDKYRHEA